MLFKDVLFASYFKAQEDKKSGVKQEVELVQRVGPRSKSSSKASSGGKSRQAAFSLLIELVKKSGMVMQSFLENVLMPMLDSVEKPKGWNFTPPS